MELQDNIRGNIRNTILLPFVDETMKALESMADLKGESDLLTYRDPLDVFNFKDFAVCIVAKSSDGVAGKIIMNFNLNTALAIGNRVLAKMLGTVEEATELTAEVTDALAEFSNTIIGLATRHLSETDYQITFGAPIYLLNKEDSEFLLEGVQQIMSVPIDIKDVGRFYFSYLLHSEV